MVIYIYIFFKQNKFSQKIFLDFIEKIAHIIDDTIPIVILDGWMKLVSHI